MAQLRIEYGDGRVVELPLGRPEMVLGRDASCDIPLDDAITSRRHARLYRDPGSGVYFLQDLQSKNGTVVNAKPIQTSAIHEGDRIEIGGCVISLRNISGGGSVVLTDPKSDTSIQPSSTSAWGTQQRLELSQRRLEKLYELQTQLTGIFDRDELLSKVLDICVETLRLERAGVALWRGAPHPPQWVGIRNHRGDDAEFRISRSLVDRTLHNAERILIHDTADAVIDPTASMISNNIRSAMCVPMEYHGAVRGVLYGDRITSTGGYTREDIDFFAALGRMGAMSLVNVQLVEEMKQRQEMEMQLKWAREIQAHLLPGEALQTGGVTIDAVNDPGQKVSGDYFDYFVRPDGSVFMVVADVCGKGAPAALLMANFQAAVHVLAEGSDLVRIASRLNRLVCENVKDSRFITGVLGVIDPGERTFTYINAGHMEPLLLREDGGGSKVEKVHRESAMPLGLEPDNEYAAHVIDFAPGESTLVLYSDGVTDAEDAQGEQFGEERLMAALASTNAESPTDLVARVRRSISQFTRNAPLTDDVTILAARIQ